MKKWLSVLLSISMLASTIPGTVLAAENKFSDVTGSEYYAKAADELSELKVIEGYTDGTFSADKPITRAEMAAIVCRAIEKEVEEKDTKTEFSDVQAEHWASSYIQAATEEKIINGYGDGKFCPEANVKYEEALKMVVCALGYGEEVQIDEKDWSAGYIDVANKKGITENLKGSKGTAATRGDVAVMIHDGLTADLVAPVISLATGEYTGTQKVTLSTTTKDAEIYYTVDGTEPGVGSTRYVKEIDISKTSTLKAVSVLDGVLTSDVTSAEYTIKAVARSGGGGGGGGGSSSSSKKYTVTFDLNYEGATDAPDKQTIKKGECVEIPEMPMREGYVFVGWYTDKDFEEIFDFSQTIKKSYTLIARWVDVADTTDTDGDGLTDPVEEYYGTDINKADTDDDGLTDYFEIRMSMTDPFTADADNNGVNDSDEDFDADGLTNLQEQENNCEPYSDDTDMDGLSDYDELNTHLTKPDVEDTDEDGLPDGDEIKLGLDPLVQMTDGTTLDSERIFEQNLSESNISEDLKADDNAAKPSLYMNTNGNVDSSTTIVSDDTEALTANKSVIGMPVSVSTSSDMSLGECVLSFNIGSTEAFTLSEEEETSKYLICKYSETEDSTDIQPLDTTYSDGVLSAAIENDGTYFVLDTEAFLTNLGIDVLSVFEESEEEEESESADILSAEVDESNVIPHLSQEERRIYANEKFAAEETAVINAIEELDEELSLKSTATMGAKAQADIVFIIDATGSMYEAINNVATNVNAFADDLVNKYKINANFSVIEFQDITHDGEKSTIQHKNGSSSWWNAKDVDLFKNKVNSIEPDDGGDWAETPIDGLAMARELVSSSSTQKFFVLITDAPYKEDNQYGVADMAEMVSYLVEDDINVSVITDDWSYGDYSDGMVSGYKDLYEKTNGVYGYIYDDSFSTVLNKIADMINAGVSDGSWIVLDNLETVKLSENPSADSKADSDEDGVLDIDELTISRNTNLKEYISAYLETVGLTYEKYLELGGDPYVTVWSFKSRPDMPDTDYDGYTDKYDKTPKKWDISDRDLAMCASVVYEDVPAGTALDKLITKYPSMAEGIQKNFDENTNLSELKGWKVLDTWYAYGLQAAAYVKDRNIVVAYRGSEDAGKLNSGEFWLDWAVADVLGYITGLNAQVPPAKSFIKKIMKEYSSYDIYVAGHSLGGNLAYNAGAKALSIDKNRVKKVNTYNGLGLIFGLTMGITDLADEYYLTKNATKVNNFSVEGDPVSKGFIGGTTFHYGTTYTVELCKDAYGAHDLHSFYDKLLLRSNPDMSTIMPSGGGGGRW